MRQGREEREKNGSGDLHSSGEMRNSYMYFSSLPSLPRMSQSMYSLGQRIKKKKGSLHIKQI